MKFLDGPCRKAYLVPALVAVLLTFPGCRSLLTIPSQRLAIPPREDGRLEDFSKNITSQLFENGMTVGIGNDDRNLYVFFSPDIRLQRRRPGRATLTVWLDDGGGKARKLGLAVVSDTALPGRRAGEKEPEIKGEEPPAPQGPPAEPTAERLAQPLLKIIDRQDNKETLILADGSLGPCARLSSDWGDFAYQLRIPLQAAANGDWPGLHPAPGKAIGIGLFWKIDSIGSARKDGSERFQGEPPPGGAEGDGQEMGPPGGMRRGGHGRGPGRGFPGDNSTRKRTIWLKTVLSRK
jgi:hypothetical protein